MLSNFNYYHKRRQRFPRISTKTWNFHFQVEITFIGQRIKGLYYYYHHLLIAICDYKLSTTQIQTVLVPQINFFT